MAEARSEKAVPEAPGFEAGVTRPARLDADSGDSSITEFRVMLLAMVRLAGAAGGVVLVTALMRAVAPRWHLANLSMLYMLAIMVTAVLAGRGPAIVAALLSFLALDYYFLHPVGHLTVSNPDEWVALLIFLVSSLVSGQMAAILRTRAEEARQSEREMATLYELSTATAGQVELGPILTYLAERVRESFGGAPCEFLLWDRNEYLRPIDLPTGSDSRPLAEFALRSGSRDYGRMRVGGRADGWPLTATERRLLQAFARHAAIAIDRGRLAREAHEARLLRDSDALKSTLLSAVSHDLRTPLAGIKALTTTLLQQDLNLPPEVVRDALQGIDEETDRMTRLVGDLLDLSRIEAGVLRPTREAVLIPELIDDTLDRLTTALGPRTILRELPADLPLILLDYVQMQQVLTNLLENAARYTPASSPITVGAAGTQESFELWVADHGPGVPEDQRERVFDRFYRLEHHETEKHGTGMGLAISRGLVEAHGGRLWVCETPGGGATFRLSVPIAQSGQPADHPSAVVNQERDHSEQPVDESALAEPVTGCP